METNGDGSPNFDVKQIIDTCTKDKLQDAIQALFADDADVALLFFSGHGADQDGGYLVTTVFNASCYGVRMTDILNGPMSPNAKTR